MKRTLRNDQTGMVAIVVTMIMMFVITLIVLGFADVTRRNQREALDSQLGLQAYYAAETGVNDITNALEASVPISNHSVCNDTFNGADGVTLPRKLSSGTDTSVANTCLLVDTTPPKLIADSIPATTGSVQWKVSNASGAAFTKLNLKWLPDAPTPGNCSASVGTYPTAGDWAAMCNLALVRVDILKANVTSTAAASLAANTATLYLQPRPPGGQQDVPIASFGGSTTAYQGACGAANCSVNINLTGAASASDYYVRITSLYRTAKNIELTGEDTTGRPAKFKDGQVVVDSTGRAQDQLKRIKVRIPLGQTQNSQPVYGVQSTGTICKDIIYSPIDYLLQSCNGIWPTINVAPVAGDLNPNGAFAEGLVAPPSGGGPAPAPGKDIQYSRNFSIVQAPVGLTINSCTWGWGDGTSNTYASASCQLGSIHSHAYDSSIPTCTFYTVNLTFNTSDGNVVAPARQIKEPHGVGSGC